MNTVLETTALDVQIVGLTVCRNLTFSIRRPQCWAILGKNGAGKTTLLHTLAGLRPYDHGSIRLLGKDIDQWPRRDIARHIGVTFQDCDDRFPSTVLESALVGRHPFLKPWQWENDDDRSIARAALRAVGLAGLDHRIVSTLSGGERRRLAIATALTQDPDLYLLDEPTNHLDVHHQIAVLDTITRRVREQGKSAMMILHDANLASRYCDHVLLLYGDGRHECGPVSTTLTEANLASVYGHPIHRIRGPAADVFVPG